MGTPANVLLLFTAFSASLYWTLKPSWVKARYGVILGTSAVLIFLYNPRVLVVAAIVTVWAFIVSDVAGRLSNAVLGKRLLWLILLPLVIDNWMPLGDILPLPTNSQLSPLVLNTASLGLSYYSLKLYASMHTAHRSGVREPAAIVSTVLFFPSFAIGPIDEAKSFGESVVSRSFSGEAALRGLARIGTGVAKVYVIAPFIADDLGRRFVGQDLTTLGGWGSLSTTEAIAATYLAFVRLFFDFSGFTSIAVGTALLFNINVSENFKAPFLANSIQNFWQRWHLSLSRFITTYLFQPMVRATGKPRLSMIAAFVLIGMWHEPTVGYLIWGVGHGAALGWYFGRSRGRKRSRTVDYFRLRTWASIAVTISYVAFMSAVANLRYSSSIAAYIRALVPFGLP
jgi:D-alanyl-lipoteichoic acid acyltransferase DltB (MBOAT superfamily)